MIVCDICGGKNATKQRLGIWFSWSDHKKDILNNNLDLCEKCMKSIPEKFKNFYNSTFKENNDYQIS